MENTLKSEQKICIKYEDICLDFLIEKCKIDELKTFEDQIKNDFSDYFNFESEEQNDFYFKITKKKFTLINEIDVLIVLILTIMNRFPNNYHKFIFSEFDKILENKSYIKNYESNVELMLTEINKLKLTNISYYYSLSSIVAAFVGDSIGSFVEFTSPSDENQKRVWMNVNQIFGTTKGQVTDDSEMALSLLFGLCDNKFNNNEKFDYDLLAFYYGLWVRSDPFDIGNTTINALQSFKSNRNNKYLAYPKNSNYYDNCVLSAYSLNKDSLSNGFLMRHTPMTFFLFWKFNKNIMKHLEEDDYKSIYDLVYELNKKDVSITHSNPATFEITFLYDLLIFNILFTQQSEFPKKDISSWVYNKMKQYLANNLDTINKYSCLAELNSFILNMDRHISESQAYLFIKQQKIGTQSIGYVMHALKLSFFFLKFYAEIELRAKKLNSSPFEEIMFLICNLGGDTDTNCCIVGGVVGALEGLDGINGCKNEYVKDTMELVPTQFKTGNPRKVLYSPGLCLFLSLDIYRNLIPNLEILSMFNFELKKNQKYQVPEEDINQTSNESDNKFIALLILLQLFFKRFDNPDNHEDNFLNSKKHMQDI